jgi:hypothetical protein
MVSMFSVICTSERAQSTLEAIGIGKDFLSRAQMAQQLRERIEKMGLHDIKKLCTTKEMDYRHARPCSGPLYSSIWTF